MNRRGFLQQAMLAAAALAVDPERLLWTPGKKTIFIPPVAPVQSVAYIGFEGKWYPVEFYTHRDFTMVYNIALASEEGR